MKNIFSLILAFAVALSAFTAVLAEDVAAVYDTKASDVLLAIEAIDSVSDFASEVTRGQYAAYIADIIFNNSLDFVKVEYADVPQNHTYYREISLMSDLGAMKGRDTRIFAPDDKITFNEAIKVVVYVLGYGEIADAKGGYPYGYLAVANGLDITAGINQTGNLTNGDVYALLYNCLETKHMMATSFEGDNVNLQKSNTSFLSILGFEHIDDVIISSNGFTSVYGASPVSEGFFVADGVRYKDMTGKSYELIGCRVDMYYNADVSTKPVTYLEPVYGTQILEVASDSIVTLDASGMTYEDGDKNKTVKFGADVDCIYNYALADFGNLTKDDLANASVKCIGSGNGYSLVHIFRYTDYYVKHIDYNENKIIDKLTNQVIDFDDFNTFYLPLKDETEASFASIKADQLVSVAWPKSGNTAVVVRSETTIGGKIDQSSDQGVYIADKLIKITDELAASEFAPRLGDMGTFFINPNGYGAMFIKTSSRNFRYGYVIEGKISTGMESVLRLRILSDSGKIIEAESGDKCIIDGVKCAVSDSRFSSLYINWLSDDRNPKADIQPQLIRYNLDSDGKLSMIDTEYTDEKDDPEGLVSKNGLLADLTGRPYYHTFENKIAVGTDGIQFWVPDDLSITDEKYFKVVTGGVADNRDPDVKPYDENDVNYSPAVVCYEPAGAGVATSGTLFLVGEVSKCIVDEEEVYKVKGLYDGKEKECYVTQETMKDYVDARKTSLEPGDIFTCNISDAGYITAFTMRYNIDDRYNFESGLPYNMNWLTETYFMTATVRKVDDVFFRLAYGWRDDDELTDDFINSAENIVTQQYWAPIYVFNQKSGEYRVGSLGDLKGYDDFGTEASRVFVYFSWGQCACVVIMNLDE